MKPRDHETDQPEPVENWIKIYILLIAALAVVILLFIWFTNYFS